MADDDLGLDEGGASAPAGKGGGLGSVLPNILKWVAIAIGAIILIGTVSFVVVKLVTSNTTNMQTIPVAGEYVPSREILDWYSAIGVIRTRTSDPVAATVSVEVVLGYKKEDKVAATELTARLIEIKDFLRRYFTAKTAAELQPVNEDKLKIEIRNAINDDILSGSKIREVRFLSLDVISQ